MLLNDVLRRHSNLIENAQSLIQQKEEAKIQQEKRKFLNDVLNQFNQVINATINKANHGRGWQTVNTSSYQALNNFLQKLKTKNPQLYTQLQTKLNQQLNQAAQKFIQNWSNTLKGNLDAMKSAGTTEWMSGHRVYMQNIWVYDVGGSILGKYLKGNWGQGTNEVANTFLKANKKFTQDFLNKFKTLKTPSQKLNLLAQYDKSLSNAYMKYINDSRERFNISTEMQLKERQQQKAQQQLNNEMKELQNHLKVGQTLKVVRDSNGNVISASLTTTKRTIPVSQIKQQIREQLNLKPGVDVGVLTTGYKAGQKSKIVGVRIGTHNILFDKNGKLNIPSVVLKKYSLNSSVPKEFQNKADVEALQSLNQKGVIQELHFQNFYNTLNKIKVKSSVTTNKNSILIKPPKFKHGLLIESVKNPVILTKPVNYAYPTNWSGQTAGKINLSKEYNKAQNFLQNLTRSGMKDINQAVYKSIKLGKIPVMTQEQLHKLDTFQILKKLFSNSKFRKNVVNLELTKLKNKFDRFKKGYIGYEKIFWGDTGQVLLGFPVVITKEAIHGTKGLIDIGEHLPKVTKYVIVGSYNLGKNLALSSEELGKEVKKVYEKKGLSGVKQLLKRKFTHLKNKAEVGALAGALVAFHTSKKLGKDLYNKIDKDYLTIKSGSMQPLTKAASNVVLTDLTSGALLKASDKLKDAIIMLKGDKFISPEDMYAEEAMNGEGFSLAKSTKETLREMENIKKKYGAYYVSHASDISLIDKAIMASRKGALDLEDQGLYVTPLSESAGAFHRIDKMNYFGKKVSLNPIKGVKETIDYLFNKIPTLNILKVEGVSYYPEDVIKEGGFTSTRKFLESEGREDVAYITKRSLTGKGEIKPQLYDLELKKPIKNKLGFSLKVIRDGEEVDVKPGDYLKNGDKLLTAGTTEDEMILNGLKNVKIKPLSENEVADELKGKLYTKYNGRIVRIVKGKVEKSEESLKADEKKIINKILKNEIADAGEGNLRGIDAKDLREKLIKELKKRKLLTNKLRSYYDKQLGKHLSEFFKNLKNVDVKNIDLDEGFKSVEQNYMKLINDLYKSHFGLNEDILEKYFVKDFDKKIDDLKDSILERDDTKFKKTLDDLKTNLKKNLNIVKKVTKGKADKLFMKEDKKLDRKLEKKILKELIDKYGIDFNRPTPIILNDEDIKGMMKMSEKLRRSEPSNPIGLSYLLNYTKLTTSKATKKSDKSSNTSKKITSSTSTFNKSSTSSSRSKSSKVSIKSSTSSKTSKTSKTSSRSSKSSKTSSSTSTSSKTSSKVSSSSSSSGSSSSISELLSSKSSSSTSQSKIKLSYPHKGEKGRLIRLHFKSVKSLSNVGKLFKIKYKSKGRVITSKKAYTLEEALKKVLEVSKKKRSKRYLLVPEKSVKVKKGLNQNLKTKVLKTFKVLKSDYIYLLIKK